MSAHTPGPWSAQHASQKEGAFTIWKNGEFVVANVPAANEKYFRSTSAAEARANAELIAAAPDLWAALREAVQCAPHAFMCTPSVELRDRLARGEVVEMTLGKELPGCDCWKSRAAAAIAKAEGRP